MVLKVCGIIVAEGSEVELALYTLVLLESLRMKQEHDEQEQLKNEINIDEMLKNISFDDLFRRERDDDE